MNRRTWLFKFRTALVTAGSRDEVPRRNKRCIIPLGLTGLVLFFMASAATMMAQAGSAKIAATVSPAAPYFTDDLTATVKVTAASGPVPTGSITGATDGGAQQTIPLAGGVVRVNLAFFPPGSHNFVYTYSGDGNYTASSPQTLTFTVTDRPFAPVGGEHIFLNELNSTTNLYNYTAAVDSSDNIYLPDPTTNTLYKADPSGILTPVATSGLNLPDGIVLDKNDNIFIADCGNARVVEVTQAGQQSVVPITGLIQPVMVTFDPAYKFLYVVDAGNSSIVIYDVAAKTQTSFVPVVGQLSGVAVDGTGNIFFSSGAGAGGRGDVFRRDTAGNVVELNVGLPGPQGLLVDANENLYITSGYGLFLLDPHGHLTQLEFEPLDEGVVSGVLLAHGIAIDSRGEIYYPNGQTFRFVPGAGGNAGQADTYEQSVTAPESNPAYRYNADFRMYYQLPYQGSVSNITLAPGTIPFTTRGNNTLGPSGSPGLAPFLEVVQLGNTPIAPGPWSSYATLTTSGGSQYTTIIYGSGRGSAFAIAPGTITPQALSVSSIGGVAKDSNGVIYASDPEGDQVLMISSKGVTKVPFAGLNKPTQIRVDATDTVYVLDSGSSRVIKLDASGNQSIAFDLTQQTALTSLSAFTLDGGANLYVAGEVSGGQAAIYYLNSLGSQTLAVSNIALPAALEVDALGSIYTVESDNGIVRHFDLAGNGTELASGLSAPGSLAVDASGTVYVTGQAGSGVTIVHPDGTKTAYPSSLLINASALIVDNAGNLVVGDSTGKQVFSIGRAEGVAYSYNFGNVPLASTQTTPGLITNIGNLVSLGYTISPATAPFAWSTGSQACVAAEPTADAPLAAGQFCNFTLSFTPTVLGDASETLYLRDSASGTQQFPIDATGVGVAGTGAPAISLSPNAATFPGTAQGASSTPRPFTVQNTGTATATLSSISIGGSDAGAFSISTATSNACGSTLAANATCAVNVVFTPTAAGRTFNGTLSVASNDPHSPAVATLAGTSPPATGNPAATLTPAAANFGSVMIGGNASQTLTLTNTGTVSLTINTHSSPTAPFLLVNSTCPPSLAAGATCTYTIAYSPTASGVSTASFSVTDAAGTQSSTLTGTGTSTAAPAATLTPSKLDFGSISTGTTTAAQTATLTNTGNATLNISSISVTGTNNSSFTATNNCGSALAAGGSCTISVVFAPSAAGTDSATLTVTDNAAGSPQTSTLTGAATTPPPSADFTLTATPASQTVASGSSAVYQVTVASLNGTFTQAVTLAASGLPTGATVSFTPSSVTPGSSGSASTMTIQTGAQQAALRDNSPKWPVPIGLISAAILVLPFRRRRRILSSLGCLVLLLILGGAMSACGGGFGLPQTNPAPTTYTVTVNGTSGSLQHSTSVQITVR